MDTGQFVFSQPYCAKPSPVVKDQLGAIVEMKNNSGVAVGLLRVQKQRAGHFEVNDQRFTAGKAKNQVLAPSLKASYSLPREFTGKLFYYRPLLPPTAFGVDAARTDEA